MVEEYDMFVTSITKLKNPNEFKLSGSIFLVLMLLQFVVLFMQKHLEKEEELQKKYRKLNKSLMDSLIFLMLSVVISNYFFVLLGFILMFIYIAIFLMAQFNRSLPNNIETRFGYLVIKIVNFVGFLGILIKWSKTY